MKDIPRGVVNPVSSIIAVKERLEVVQSLLYDVVNNTDYAVSDEVESKLTGLMASTLYSLESVNRILEEINGPT